MVTFLRESFVYLLIAGSVQCIGALILAVFFFPLGRYYTRRSFTELLRPYLLFNVFLLFWGCLGHFAFHSLTFGKLYYSADRVVDWFPFIPFGQWILNQTLGTERSYLIDGATLGHLRMIWLAIAMPVWLFAYGSTIRTMRFMGVANAGQRHA